MEKIAIVYISECISLSFPAFRWFYSLPRTVSGPTTSSSLLAPTTVLVSRTAPHLPSPSTRLFIVRCRPSVSPRAADASVPSNEGALKWQGRRRGGLAPQEIRVERRQGEAGKGGAGEVVG